MRWGWRDANPIARLVLVWMLGPAALAGAQPAPPTVEDCLACHQDPELRRADGRPVFVDPKKFGASIHGGLSCVDCHADLAAVELPHAERLRPVACGTCHPEPVAEHAASVHGRARAADPSSPAATCVDCHGAHDIRASADPESRTYHLNLPDTCGHCHGNPDVIKRGHIEIGDVVSLYQDSIHGRALARSGLTVAPNCSDCHGAHDIQRLTDPASRVYRGNVPATCGRCHEGVRRQFDESVHGTLLAKGNPTAPACHDCHTAHEIQRTETTRWQLEVVRECGTCHVESIRTYRDTFHGQVTALGFTRVAKCADCHTAHQIQPARDPRSSVAPANLVGTCRRCHAGASENFVKYDPHADKTNRARNPYLYYAARFMRSLLVFVFSFFGVHTALWVAREAGHRRRARVRAAAEGPAADRAAPGAGTAGREAAGESAQAASGGAAETSPPRAPAGEPGEGPPAEGSPGRAEDAG
jgi:hypothetical protein